MAVLDVPSGYSRVDRGDFTGGFRFLVAVPQTCGLVPRRDSQRGGRSCGGFRCAASMPSPARGTIHPVPIRLRYTGDMAAHGGSLALTNGTETPRWAVFPTHGHEDDGRVNSFRLMDSRSGGTCPIRLLIRQRATAGPRNSPTVWPPFRAASAARAPAAEPGTSRTPGRTRSTPPSGSGIAPGPRSRTSAG